MFQNHEGTLTITIIYVFIDSAVTSARALKFTKDFGRDWHSVSAVVIGGYYYMKKPLEYLFSKMGY